VSATIACFYHPAPACGTERVLLVMLPGVGIEAAAFAQNGMVAQLHERGLAVDVIAASPALDLYLDGDVAAALHNAVIAPALAQGYTRIWLLGISLGGMGALLYASAHEALLEGIFLLAPFLGTQGTVAEIADAGGIAAWVPAGSAATAPEQRILTWLQGCSTRKQPKIYLGCGQSDRFARGHLLLAEILPPDRVVFADGGHDWPTWLALWARLLDSRPISNGGSLAQPA